LEVPERNDWQSDWMERGEKLEQEAIDWFALDRDVNVIPVGLVLDVEHGWLSASPDAIISRTAPLEVKCPAASTHIRWLADGVVPKEHMPQVAFQAMLMESPVAYFMSYHPLIRPLIVRLDRRQTEFDAFMKSLETVTGEFIEECNKLMELLEE
jgi:hypothetical protein